MNLPQVLAEGLKGHGFILQGGGTDNHLILANVKKSFDIDGKFYEKALDMVGLTLNANALPGDTGGAFRPGGVRLGTPAITTRGMGIKEMQQIADWMLAVAQICQEAGDEDGLTQHEGDLEKIRTEVKELSLKFPVPAID